MFEIEGANATATVMADWSHISDETISQIHMLVSHPAIQNDFVVQADGHKASGAVVGFTMPLGTRIAPTLIGFDISCGMRAFKLTDLPMENAEREAAVRDSVPTGRGMHTSSDAPSIQEFPWDKANKLYRQFSRAYEEKFGSPVSPSFEFTEYDEDYVTALCDRIGLSEHKISKAAGTLGSSNHFIEFGQSAKTDEYWCTVHSGSRHLGKAVGRHHVDRAHRLREGDDNRGNTSLDWLEADEAHNYFIDMIFCHMYANWNRQVMADRICDALNATELDAIEAPHNYIDFRDMTVRKGAVAARSGEKLVVPLNMADGIFICEGKGSDAHLQTAPHGAGRVKSRSEAKDTVDIDDFEDAVSDVYTEAVGQGLLSESPQAYKSSAYIRDELESTARIVDHLRPVHNLKGN